MLKATSLATYGAQKSCFDEKNKVNLIDLDWAGPFDMKISACGPRRSSRIAREQKLTGQMVIM
jgi:hypothetical protein